MLIRLFIEDKLSGGVVIPLQGDKLHYVATVMRVENSQAINVFNDKDGEYKASVNYQGRHKAFLNVEEKLKEPEIPSDVWLLFAPVKRDCTDLIAEKASELDVSVIMPVITKRTIVSRVNTSRLKAIAIEASEQCRRISIPEIREPISLEAFLQTRNPERRLIFLDETGNGAPIAQTLKTIKSEPLAFLVGPEGGFAPEELELLRHAEGAIGVSLDHHILRSETACIAALALRKYLL